MQRASVHPRKRKGSLVVAGVGQSKQARRFLKAMVGRGVVTWGSITLEKDDQMFLKDHWLLVSLEGTRVDRGRAARKPLVT